MPSNVHTALTAQGRYPRNTAKLKLNVDVAIFETFFSKIILCKINVSVKIKIETNNMMILKYFLAKKTAKIILNQRLLKRAMF